MFRGQHGRKKTVGFGIETDGTKTGAPSVRALAVGDPGEWQQQGYALPTDGLAFVEFHDVTTTTLEFLQPSLVFSPVLARQFDCIDLAITLHKLGYSGEYRALAVGFPKPAVIEREVRQMCPHLNFKIVESI